VSLYRNWDRVRQIPTKTSMNLRRVPSCAGSEAANLPPVRYALCMASLFAGSTQTLLVQKRGTRKFLPKFGCCGSRIDTPPQMSSRTADVNIAITLTTK
jgi:hypothetical protein